MRTTILGTFFMSSPAEVEEGVSWYQRANTIARQLADEYGLALTTVAGVIAALSPQNNWERNVRDANNIIAAYKVGGSEAAKGIRVGTFNRNKDKAVQILQSYSTDVESVLGGLKVQNFYRSILLDGMAVCIDGHAYSVWLGERVTTSNAPKITPKLYEEIKQDYIAAADNINEVLGTSYSPFQIQAITWVTHRNMYAGKRKSRKG